VAYIITSQEKDVFSLLTTDEERDQFVEQFWARRDPDPRTADNEFRVEHYRRIAYANDHFVSGKPGWKTDRGRLYIQFGPPDEIHHYPTGHVYNRDLKEGGGHTTTHPYEVWFYRHLDGIGSGIEIEFVDASLSGEYRMALSPEEKDAMLFVSGAGNTLLEELGYETREDRVRNMGIQDVSGANMFRWGELNHVFERYQTFFQLRQPPEIRLKDLRQMVDTKISYSLLPLDFNWHFIQLSPGAFMAAVTVSVPNAALTFQERAGDRRQARAEIYGLVQTLSGKLVYEFEDVLASELPAAVFTRPQGAGHSLYQRNIPLVPGRFKLTLVIKDAASGNASVLERALIIPAPGAADVLATSSLIIGDRVTPAGREEFLTDPFVLEGNLKIYPNVSGRVRNGTSVAGYIEVYNAAVDGQSLRPDCAVTIDLYRNGQPSRVSEDTISKVFPIFKGDKLVLFWMQTLRVPDAERGEYDLRVSIHDKIRGANAVAAARLSIY
jgi:GWxTD domain-containing protein